MAEGRPSAEPGAPRAPRLLPSVRVRITLAATAVTAVTVVATGFLLVRHVEDNQLGEVARRTSARVDEVAAALADGRSPAEAVLPAAGSATSADGEVAVQVSDERGCPVAINPVISDGAGSAALQLGSGTITASLSAGGETPATGDSDVDSDADADGDGDGDGDGEANGDADADAGSMVVERADGSTITCPVPEALEPPEAAPPGEQADETTRSPQTNRLRFISQASVSRFPFERVSTTVVTDTGTYTIEAAAPVDEVRRSVDAVRQALWWVLPALIAAVAAVTWVFVGRALRPVEAIRAEVEAIGGATMHRRVPEPRSQDEVGRLARTMNAMLGRLEASARRQGQFVSDASHELRSPVATMRADLEVAQLEGARADWPAVAASVLREEARLERLIDDLLVLAAGDEDAALRRAAPVDLAAIVAEDAQRARRMPVTVGVAEAAAEAGAEAGAGAAGPAVVEGDAAQLRRVVANLVDNAARHARSRVVVTLRPSPDASVDLTVDDDGHGIAPADRDRVFERFTRLDEGRARDRGGAGLGLAVVASLVERHGGTVTVGDAPGGGARLTVAIPASRAAGPPHGVATTHAATIEPIAP